MTKVPSRPLAPKELRPLGSPGWSSAFDLVQWLFLQKKIQKIEYAALAKATGVSKDTIAGWRSGVSLPRLNHMVAFVEFFGYRLLPSREPILNLSGEPLYPIKHFEDEVERALPDSPPRKKHTDQPGSEGAFKLVRWLFLNLRTKPITRYDRDADPITSITIHARDISDPELARKAGIKKAQTIQNWRNDTVPSLESFIACVQVLGYDLIPVREPIIVEGTHGWPIRKFRQELLEALVAFDAEARQQTVAEYLDATNERVKRDTASGIRKVPVRRQV